MKILLTGASGFVGSHLIKRLLDDGHSIVACARNPEKQKALMPSVEWVACDFTQDTNKEAWLPRLKNIDVAINAVGIIEEKGEQSFANVQTKTPIALFDACAQSNVKVVQVSALGADCEGQPEFLASKRLADQHLQSLEVDSIIVYPSIVIGRGGQSTELFNAVSAFLVTPLIGDGGQKLQPIHINDVTGNISHMLANWNEPKQVHQLVGPDVITTKEMYSTLRAWLNLGSANFIKMPMWLIKPAAKMGDITGVGMLNTDTLNMLENARTPDATYSGYKSKSLKDRDLESIEIFKI